MGLLQVVFLRVW